MSPSMMRFSVVSNLTLSSGQGRNVPNARGLDGSEAIGLARPVHPVAFLADIHGLAKREFQAVEVDLPAFRADLGKQPQQLRLLVGLDVVGAQIKAFRLRGRGGGTVCWCFSAVLMVIHSSQLPSDHEKLFPFGLLVEPMADIVQKAVFLPFHVAG